MAVLVTVAAYVSRRVHKILPAASTSWGWRWRRRQTPI